MNGYIQIKIGGKPVGLKFAFPAIRMFFEAVASKNDLYFYKDEKGNAQMTVEGLAKFIQCGYMNNCIIKEVEPELKYADFFEWTESGISDPERGEEIAKVLTCYAETEYAKKLSNDQPEEKKKKKERSLTT